MYNITKKENGITFAEVTGKLKSIAFDYGWLVGETLFAFNESRWSSFLEMAPWVLASDN